MAFCAQGLLLGAQIPPYGSACHRLSSSAAAPASAAHHHECVISSAKNPLPKTPTNWTREKTLAALSSCALVAAVGVGFLRLSTSAPPPGNTGGGGGGGWGWGGFGGGDGGGFWSQIFSPLAAIVREEDPAAGGGPKWDSHGLPANIIVQLSKLSRFKRYKISEILFLDRRQATTDAGTEDSLFEMVSLRPDGVYSKDRLQKELETLASCGMFEKVDLEGKTKPDGTLALTVSFIEGTWQSANAFRCINVGLIPRTKRMEMDPDTTDREKMAEFRNQERDHRRTIEQSRPCLLPVPVEREVLQMLREQGKISARLLQRIQDRVQKWYHDEGYACAQVVNFSNLNTRELVCELVEGDVTQLVIQFLDKLGNVCEGSTQPAVVHRELPKQLQPGHAFNIEAGKQALRNIDSLGLFSTMEVSTRFDEKNEGGIIVEIKLKEQEQKSAEVSMWWSIVHRRQRRPTLASLQPGVTVSFEHRNIKGLKRAIVGSVSSSNLLNPRGDLPFKLEYVRPYVDGVYHPRNRTFRASCFNSRKLSPVFTGGPGEDGVPPVWIDRVGFKANITEAFTRQSKFTHGLVMEEITTRDGSSSICTHGVRALAGGGFSMDGPPTTLSGTGIDWMAFAQANITRDNTKYVNGAVVGERDVFQLDQGLGIGSKFPFFNRHQLTLTRFVQLKQVEEGADKPPPPVLVLHGRYGGCVGDLPSYDAFILGGPYSVRGYNMGELGACRNILELSAELRIPLRNTHVYAFAEHGNDLSSSKDVKGNPTEFFHRAGRGSSYGVGVKLGLVRAEYAVDHNAATGAIFLRFGERF